MGPSRAVRRTVYGFLGVFVACGLLSIELWPLTGFRLYSEVRTEVRTSTAVVALLPDGEERVVHLSELPIGFHYTNRIIESFPDLDETERDAICDAWVQPLRDEGVEVVGVRIDEIRRRLSDLEAPREVREAYRCGSG